MKIWSEWSYNGQSGHSNFWSEWCYSGQNVGVIKPQHVGVIVTPPVLFADKIFDQRTKLDIWFYVRLLEQFAKKGQNSFSAGSLNVCNLNLNFRFRSKFLEYKCLFSTTNKYNEKITEYIIIDPWIFKTMLRKWSIVKKNQFIKV